MLLGSLIPDKSEGEGVSVHLSGVANTGSFCFWISQQKEPELLPALYLRFTSSALRKSEKTKTRWRHIFGCRDLAHSVHCMGNGSEYLTAHAAGLRIRSGLLQELSRGTTHGLSLVLGLRQNPGCWASSPSSSIIASSWPSSISRCWSGRSCRWNL